MVFIDIIGFSVRLGERVFLVMCDCCIFCEFCDFEVVFVFFFFFQAEDGIRDKLVTGVQTCALPISPRTVRHVPGVLGLSRLPIHARPERRRAGGGAADRRDVPDLREAHGHQARTLRKVHRVLGLPGVQDDEADHARHRVPGARLRGPARRAPLAAGPHLFRLLGVPELQVRPLAAARPRAVPEVRRAVHDRARRPRPRAPAVRTRGVRLRAGGRDLGRMSDPLAAYLKYLTLERDASPHTLRSYGSDLREFQVFVGRDKPLGEVDGRTVRAYLAHLHTRGLDGASVARKLAALRSWFRFLVRRGKLARNVARDVRGPRLGRTLVSFLPIDEAQVLVDGKAVGGAARERDVAILELLYATGLRVSELSSLDIEDVDRAGATVRVLGKGRKERIVPFGRRAARALDAYLGPRAERRGTLFTNHRGGRLSVRAIHAIVRKSAAASGIARRVSPHTLRHTFATHLLHAGRAPRGGGGGGGGGDRGGGGGARGLPTSPGPPGRPACPAPAADAFTLFARFESRLEEHRGNLARAAVEVAKDWRTDRVLRRLEALLAVADREHSFIISGNGDVIEPDDGLIGIGSGGPDALAAAPALVAHSDLDAKGIVTDAMRIAASICVYTNDHISVEVL